MTKIVIDTNVLIYGRDQSSAFHSSSVVILKDPSYELFVTTKVISEYFAVCTKLGIAEADTLGFYEELKRNAFILYPDSQSITFFEDLVKRYKPKGNRVYDLEIVSVMMANDIPKLATANVKDYEAIAEIEIVPILSTR